MASDPLGDTVDQLTAITGANVDVANDVLPIHDTSTQTLKSITPQELENVTNLLTAITGANIDVDADYIGVFDGDGASKKKITVKELIANTTSFLQSGTGATARTVQAKAREIVSAFDFMTAAEVADAQAGTALVDCKASIQEAIDAHGSVYLPYATYRVSAAVQLTASYSALIGHQKMPILKIDSANGPAVKVLTTGGTALNEFSRIDNVQLYCDGAVPSFAAAPSASNCGLSIDGSAGTVANPVQRFSAINMRILGFGCMVYLKENTNTHLERVFMEQHTDWSATGGYTSSNQYVGLYFDCAPFSAGGISPQASCEVVECKVNLSGAPANTTCSGYRVEGQDPRDIYFDRCETANGTYGWYMDASDTQYNFDIQIRRPIIDAVDTTGIYVKDFSGSGAVSIEGGYITKDTNNAGALIWIDTCRGVHVGGGIQLIGLSLDGTQDEGIRIISSTSCSVIGATLLNCRYGLSLDASTYCTLAANTITAATNAAFEATPTLSDAIRLFNTATNNVVTGNTIRGASATYIYANGITVESGSTSNQLIGNQIDTTTVTTAYNDNDASTYIVSQTGIQFPSTQVSSSDVNTLDDYEEGTFTPTIAGASTAGTQTYSQQSGRYTKIGRLVHVEIRLLMTATDAATAGNLRLSGLPFTVADMADGIVGGSGVGACKFDTSAGYTQVGIVPLGNTTTALIVESGDNVATAQLAAANLLANTELDVSFCYATAT